MTTENTYVTTTGGASFRALDDVQPLALYPGEQLWRLIRGHAEGETPGRAQVVEEAVAIMRWALGHGRGSAAPWELISTGDNQWTLGDARPLKVEAVSHDVAKVAMPPGTSYGRREQYPGDGLPVVVGTAPWYVLVRFWWRGPSGKAAAWPALGFGTSAPNISQLGWMLDSAIVPKVKSPDPGDKSWGKAQIDEALEPGTKAAQGVLHAVVSALKVAAVVGGVYVGWKIYREAKGQ